MQPTMKTVLSILALTFLTVANVFAAGAGPLRPDTQDESGPRYTHLEYFGFYASAMGDWNFTSDLAPFTNLTWIHVGSADQPQAAVQEFIARLEDARTAGVRAVLSIEPFLFLNAAGQPRADAEIEDFLIELRARIELEGLLETVAMIYPKDEPFREFVRHRDPNFIEQYVTGEVYEEVHRDLLQVNGIIELVFPDKPIGVILSGHDLHHRFFSIPANYDWVGFDCYDNLFRGCDDRSFVQHYRRLLDFMQPHQRLMAVPETWALGSNLDRADWPDVLMSRLRHHYEIALSEPRFIAFVPFIWSLDRGEDAPELGLEGFPEHYDDGLDNRGSALLEEVRSIGQQIKLGQPVYPNLAWSDSEDTPARPPESIRGGIIDINRDGELNAWAYDDALPHKNLRVQVLLRDARGELLHKSRAGRTFRSYPELAQPGLIGQPFIGLHGFAYRIPRQLLLAHQGETLQVELVSFTDGPERSIGHIHGASIPPTRVISSPLRLAPAGAQGTRVRRVYPLTAPGSPTRPISDSSVRAASR
jgi:hypothetical protein